MPQIPELANTLLFFAPGFLLVQTLSLGAIGGGLSGLQGVIWSIIVSAPIRWGGTRLVGLLDLGLEPGLELEVVMLGLALVLGVVASLVRRLFVFGEEEQE